MQKNINIIIIHKKINLNDHFTVSRLAEMEIGLGCKISILKIGTRKIRGSTVL